MKNPTNPKSSFLLISRNCEGLECIGEPMLRSFNHHQRHCDYCRTHICVYIYINRVQIFVRNQQQLYRGWFVFNYGPLFFSRGSHPYPRSTFPQTFYPPTPSAPQFSTPKGTPPQLLTTGLYFLLQHITWNFFCQFSKFGQICKHRHNFLE